MNHTASLEPSSRARLIEQLEHDIKTHADLGEFAPLLQALGNTPPNQAPSDSQLVDLAATLGHLYFHGIDGLPNRTLAYGWIAVAADWGQAEAAEFLIEEALIGEDVEVMSVWVPRVCASVVENLGQATPEEGRATVERLLKLLLRCAAVDYSGTLRWMGVLAQVGRGQAQ